MADMILVCGENSSGKSMLAEKLVSLTKGKRYYVATMINSNPENQKRIEKHIAQRAGLNFETLELPFGFESAELEEGRVVLLEDVANLLANLIFVRQQGLQQALAEIQKLKNKCKTLFLVSIAGLSGEGYEGETLDYVNQLNELNTILSAISDAVVEMENGEPIIRKGEKLLHDEGLLDCPVNL